MLRGIIIIGLIFSLIAGYFFIDTWLEYRYWKKVQTESNIFLDNFIEETKKASQTQLNQEYGDLQLYFRQTRRSCPDRNEVQKIFKLYVLPEALGQNCEDYSSYHVRHFRNECGLAPSCHFDFLLSLYSKKMGRLTTIRPVAGFTNFCQGWSELDQNFEYLDSNMPHARSELRY